MITKKPAEIRKTTGVSPRASPATTPTEKKIDETIALSVIAKSAGSPRPRASSASARRSAGERRRAPEPAAGLPAPAARRAAAVAVGAHRAPPGAAPREARGGRRRSAASSAPRTTPSASGAAAAAERGDDHREARAASMRRAQGARGGQRRRAAQRHRSPAQAASDCSGRRARGLDDHAAGTLAQHRLDRLPEQRRTGPPRRQLHHHGRARISRASSTIRRPACPGRTFSQWPGHAPAAPHPRRVDHAGRAGLLAPASRRRSASSAAP